MTPEAWFLPSSATGADGYCHCHCVRPTVRLSVCPSRTTLGGTMLNNVKQIAIENSYARPIFACSTELWNFQNRLEPGPRDDVAALTV